MSLCALPPGSSFILASFQDLLAEHVEVALYLTMLVGAGGNAGNQAAVHVIRELAVSKGSARISLLRELGIALCVGTLVTWVGFARVLLFEGSLKTTVAISLALFAITCSSIVLGSVLPLAFRRVGLDAAHAGPTIQVFMDISGVFITCLVCSRVL